MDDVLKQIKRVSHLQNDWDEQGSLKPSELAIEKAKEFFENFLVHCSFNTPQITPTVNEGISAFWETESFQLYLTFEADGKTIVFSGQRGTDKLSGQFDVSKSFYKVILHLSIFTRNDTEVKEEGE